MQGNQRAGPDLICTGGGLPYRFESAQIVGMAHPFIESAQIIVAVALLISAIGSAASKVILALRWGRTSQPGQLGKLTSAVASKASQGRKNDNKAG